MKIRTSIFGAMAAAAIGCTGAPAGAAALPEKPLPHGLHVLASGAYGRILYARSSGTASARKLLRAVRTLSGGYFDTPITLTRMFADRGDTRIQAAFTATLRRIPVHGVAVVQMDGATGKAGLLFDDARTFTRSFPTLLSHTSGGSGSKGGQETHPAPVHLTRQTAPDGSCQISLPAGFRIADAYQGTLDITGPNGAYMGLGGRALGTSPDAAALFPGVAPIDFNDPVRAIVDLVTYQMRQQGKQAVMKIIDSRPIPGWSPGNAAFIRYSLRVDGKTTEGFGLFSVAQTDASQAVIYSSFITASPAMCRRQFPAMLQAWATYSVNPAVFRDRLMAAAQSMRGMSDIINSQYEYAQKTNDRVAEAWSDVFREQGTWKNPETGDRYKIPNSWTNNGGIPVQDGVELEPVPLGDL